MQLFFMNIDQIFQVNQPKLKEKLLNSEAENTAASFLVGFQHRVELNWTRWWRVTKRDWRHTSVISSSFLHPVDLTERLKMLRRVQLDTKQTQTWQEWLDHCRRPSPWRQREFCAKAKTLWCTSEATSRVRVRTICDSSALLWPSLTLSRWEALKWSHTRTHTHTI